MSFKNRAQELAESLREQYEGFSQSTRVLLMIFAASIIGLGVLQAWEATEAVNKNANKLLEQMARIQESQGGVRPAFRNQVQSIGPMRLPTQQLNTLASEQKLFLAIDEILSENGAEMTSIEISPGANLPSGKLPELALPGRRLAKIGARIEFDCPQDKAAEIVRALESNPEIYSISRLQITRYKAGQEQVRRLVNIDITLESWVLGQTTRRRG